MVDEAEARRLVR
jgi:hypothetical protein